MIVGNIILQQEHTLKNTGEINHKHITYLRTQGKSYTLY